MSAEPRTLVIRGNHIHSNAFAKHCENKAIHWLGTVPISTFKFESIHFISHAQCLTYLSTEHAAIILIRH
jgi:hypothetical protein